MSGIHSGTQKRTAGRSTAICDCPAVNGAREAASKWRLPFTLASLFLLTTTASAETGIATTWLTHDGQGVVEIAPCGGKLCGRIVWLKTPTDDKGVALTDQNNPSSKLRKRPICGLAVLSGLEADKSGGWDGGKIYDPEEGDTYDAALKLAGPDKLTVTGYLGVKALGQSFTWTRHAVPAGQRCSAAARQ